MRGPDENVVKASVDNSAVADNIRIRSEMMMKLGKLIREEGITQKEAARRMGVAQPRISDLVRGKTDKFSIDMLVNMFARFGLQFEFVTAKQTS